MLELIKPFNIIIAADSYKAGHWQELPFGTKRTWSVVVPRKPSEYSKDIVALGQTFVAYVLSKVRITEDMIDEAEVEINQQGYRFNRVGWEIISRELDGKIPLAMYGVEEGRVVLPQTPVVGLLNTDDRFAWLPAYMESWVQGTIWKMSTVASICRTAKKIIKENMELTGSNMSMLDYKLHNFGDRAAGSPEESAVLAGIAHAALFSGSDCLRANGYIKKMYRTTKAYLSSVEAFEHSTICANSDTENKNDFGAAVKAVERLEDVVKMVKEEGIGIPLISVVIDTYDDTRFVNEFLGDKLKQRIIDSGGCLVARPDSGDPKVQPGIIGKFQIKNFGGTKTSTGHDSMAPCVGVLQGDGIRIATLEGVIKGWTSNNLSMDNFVMGMGSGTSNDCQRDDFSWSMKAIASKTDEGWRRLSKDPITDPGKKSLSGLIRCRENHVGELEVFDALTNGGLWEFEVPSAGWRLWYKDGYQVFTQSFDDVKARASENI